ncbi:MAG: glycine--tRNA ligase subunit alpha, partial [Pseudomonadota bacterium]
LQNEQEFSRFGLEFADTDILFRHFDDHEKEAQALLQAGAAAMDQSRSDADPAGLHKCSMPAYDQAIKASHVFNLLDARGVISVTERQSYILRVRNLAKACGEAYVQTRDGGAS